uniref:Uncharacterized protein n=1 Tax=Physcomitrium patens TaxID=3218 RepID=A0A2K1J145_PHYPA|nr:hypothetical protein PHYPA_023135 [Physcomitrium patens]
MLKSVTLDLSGNKLEDNFPTQVTNTRSL